MEQANFTDDLFDLAFKALAFNNAKTEVEKQSLQLICDICERHGVSVRKYMAILCEVDIELKKLKQEDDNAYDL